MKKACESAAVNGTDRISEAARSRVAKQPRQTRTGTRERMNPERRALCAPIAASQNELSIKRSSVVFLWSFEQMPQDRVSNFDTLQYYKGPARVGGPKKSPAAGFVDLARLEITFCALTVCKQMFRWSALFPDAYLQMEQSNGPLLKSDF